MERYQKETICKDLHKKMVFLAGPRQAGKTTLAKEIAKNFGSSIYLNFDSRSDQKIILEESWHPNVELLIFDEIHKMPHWKSYLKGVYDTKKEYQKILVTGSARLEIFNQVGDSLAGRYFLHRLMPLSPAELTKVAETSNLDRFLDRGGFPEPYLTEDPVDAQRWRNQYVDSLLRIDVLDFDHIQNLRAIQLLFELLKERVGSPISYQSIAEDVSISPNTVKKYISILEALYVIFRIIPFSKNIARSLLKEPKIYFFDTGLLKADRGIQFENLVACSLFKHLCHQVDTKAKNISLYYLRTKEQKEVDFAIVEDQKIKQLIEVKHKKSTIDPNLLYFKKKYDFPSILLVKDLEKERVSNGIEILNGHDFLKNLSL